MFEFASELSPPFAIWSPTLTSNSTTLQPGDIRLIEPSDIPIPFQGGAPRPWPEADRIVLQVDPRVNATGQTVTILLYPPSIPYPVYVVGENVPLPAPGTVLEYFFNITSTDTYPYDLWQVVVVPSLQEIDIVLAASGTFLLSALAPGTVPSDSLSATATVTLTEFNSSEPISSNYLINAPSSSLLSTGFPLIQSATQSASPSSGSGSDSVSVAVPTAAAGNVLLLSAASVGLLLALL
ncbi:hypothetical protein DACRYDRAFT_109720 [Dacryopinax primogenitus]|uniref:Uncharacterized protein n=1 Tax=Dacryopinax primogenitus (strain DJM 731) TaxID=1858805 RepID=M5FTY9_DACPD|nr:uncharacterized protein DACRYDRAFT_109720 [Dacryopinax primogenitus]EJT99618.1 hypothetical protein DACRYDRAFT_109720 [Dacryopinax primogenitus]